MRLDLVDVNQGVVIVNTLNTASISTVAVSKSQISLDVPLGEPKEWRTL
jgi:hypothetical protein